MKNLDSENLKSPKATQIFRNNNAARSRKYQNESAITREKSKVLRSDNFSKLCLVNRANATMQTKLFGQYGVVLRTDIMVNLIDSRDL